MVKKIAIVEDDPDQRGNYVDAITRKGYSVTAYQNRAAIYHRGLEQIFDELRLADNEVGTFNTYDQEIHNSLYVGHSRGNGDVTGQRTAHFLYDGPSVIADSHFAGFGEETALTFTASASDPDLPANALTFSLDAGAPAGASIHAMTGVFSWTPTEAQGPGSYDVTIRVTDNGTPAMDDFQTFFFS